MFWKAPHCGAFLLFLKKILGEGLTIERSDTIFPAPNSTERVDEQLSGKNFKSLPKAMRRVFELDRKNRAELEERSTTRTYDFAERKDAATFERRVADDLAYGDKLAKKIYGEKGKYKMLERDGLWRRRKKEAAIRFAPDADTFYSGIYPNLCIAEELSKMNAAPIELGLPLFETGTHIQLAAAIWMLDALKDSGHLQEALALVDNGAQVCDDPILLNLYDPAYSNEVICSMVSVIRNRNSNDEGTELTGRQKFDGILSLIEESARSFAVSRFEQKQWEHFENVLYGINRLRELELEHLDEAFQAVETSERIHAQFLILEKELDKKAVSPLEQFPIPGYTDSRQGGLLEIGRLNSIEQRGKELIEENQAHTSYLQGLFTELDEIDRRRLIIRTMAGYLVGAPEGVTGGRTYDEYEERICSLSVDDPFEMCFAYIYMRHMDLDSAWLYTQAMAIINLSVSMLPWYVPSEVKRDWGNPCEELSSYTTADEDAECEDLIDAPNENLSCAIKGLYQKVYSDAALWADPEEVPKRDLLKVNLSQLVYGLTETLMPRREPIFENIEENLKLSRIKKDQRMPYMVYLLLARSLKNRLARDSHIPLEVEPEDDSVERIQDLRDENEKLNSALKELHRDRNSERKRAEKAEQMLEQQRCELAELRSMIYDRKKLEKENKDTSVQFPYTVSCRIVIFGGHDTWISCIKPLLSGVRFVSPTAKPNVSMILNTDVIWLQTNVMGHSYYNKIVDTARAHDIPVKYFSFSGAEKCAEQLALDDLEMKRKAHLSKSVEQ